MYSSGKTSRHQLYAVNFNVLSAPDATANAKVSLAKRASVHSNVTLMLLCAVFMHVAQLNKQLQVLCNVSVDD